MTCSTNKSQGCHCGSRCSCRLRIARSHRSAIPPLVVASLWTASFTRRWWNAPVVSIPDSVAPNSTMPPGAPANVTSLGDRRLSRPNLRSSLDVKRGTCEYCTGQRHEKRCRQDYSLHVLSASFSNSSLGSCVSGHHILTPLFWLFNIIQGKILSAVSPAGAAAATSDILLRPLGSDYGHESGWNARWPSGSAHVKRAGRSHSPLRRGSLLRACRS